MKPWQLEPNYACGQINGRRWIIMRGPFGFLCGYVEILAKDKKPEPTESSCSYEAWPIDCHGGLTYDGNRPFSYWETKTENGPPYHLKTVEVYCIGFDCAHYGDYIPGLPLSRTDEWMYKSFEYVMNEIKSICDQLDAAAITEPTKIQ